MPDVLRVNNIIIRGKKEEKGFGKIENKDNLGVDSWVTSIKIKYLSDHNTWLTYGILSANYNQSDARIIKILLFTKAVRIYPVEFHNSISMKVDITVDGE